MIQWRPLPDDTGVVLERIQCANKSTTSSLDDLENAHGSDKDRVMVLLNGNLNHQHDIQDVMVQLKSRITRSTRIAVVAYNPYFHWLYTLAGKLGLRLGEIPFTFVTHADLNNFCKLSGFDVIRSRPVVHCPWWCLGLGTVVNWVMPTIPLLRHLGLASVIYLRPIIPALTRPSLSIVIPARNERGNIEEIVKRMPDLDTDIEIIFVEGHSDDSTWEEIERVRLQYESQNRILSFQQTGKGKCDAVRLGFSEASKELLVILDADMTMPPEMLTRFYDAYCTGLGDFINGSRLVYPQEGEAMRFLNRLGNVFFAKALCFVLDISVSDSLCGTKLLTARDYQRAVAWRKDFGDFDPFGDFELLFPAATLALGTIDIPIRYRRRTYGSTNISRFSHGFLLLRMTCIGLLRIKTGRVTE